MNTSPRNNAGASAPTHTRRGIQVKANIGETHIPGAPEAVPLPIDDLTIDPEIQQRARIDEALIAEYAETIATWIDSAPIVVFSDGHTRWIADGFQRTAAARRAGLYAVPAIRIDGGRQDALRYALGANATHGRRRNREDLERAYQTAVREGFCEATDTEAVAALLKCSGRWASELTKAAREDAKASRDATIRRLASEGRSQREIASETGTARTTVQDVLGGRKWNSSETGHPDAPAAEPQSDEAAKVALDAEIARLAEEGKTQREIAEELGIPKSTVDRLAPKRKTSEMGQAGAVANHAQGDAAHEPVIIEEVEGDDLSEIRAATVKLQAEVPDPAPAGDSTNKSIQDRHGRAPAPATPAPKGPTAKEAMQTMLQVTGWLGKMSRVEEALLESDARTLIKELRRALERLVARFERKEVEHG